MFEYDFLCVSDGGALGNEPATPKAYGSYRLATRDGRRQTVRLELGTATNNEAEYRTLIAALKDLAGPCSPNTLIRPYCGQAEHGIACHGTHTRSTAKSHRLRYGEAGKL